MQYAFQVRPHANVRYLVSQLTLAQKELTCMLRACGAGTDVELAEFGGTPFLCFENSCLSDLQLRWLGGHSSLYMTAVLQNNLLCPLELPQNRFLPPDMPEVLKYKGKTNATFTQLLVNLALSAGGHTVIAEPMRLIDPICGRGTALYSALSRGMNAAGIESDANELREGIAFTERYLQFHHVKHRRTQLGLSLPHGENAPCTRFEMTDGNGTTRELSFILADTRNIGKLMRSFRGHALVADLPYGVQHAPAKYQKIHTFDSLLADALPAWREALLPGCAAAISFNRYTINRKQILDALSRAGFQPLCEPPYNDFSHWVEQAIDRDIAVAIA